MMLDQIISSADPTTYILTAIPCATFALNEFVILLTKASHKASKAYGEELDRLKIAIEAQFHERIKREAAEKKLRT